MSDMDNGFMEVYIRSTGKLGKNSKQQSESYKKQINKSAETPLLASLFIYQQQHGSQSSTH